MLSGDGGEFSRSKEEAKDENCSEATADDVASADSDSDTDSNFSSLSDAPFGAVDAFSGWWVTRGNAARGELSVSAKTFAFLDGPTVPTRFLGCDKLELLFEGRRHRGVLKGDGFLHWDDGDVWTRVVESQFGFRLHSKVRLLRGYLGAAAGECGTVVGFTRAFVEVKCAARIVRCSGCDLRLCEPEAAVKIKASAAATSEESDGAEPEATSPMSEPEVPMETDATAAAILEESDEAEPEVSSPVSGASWEAPTSWMDVMRARSTLCAKIVRKERSPEMRCRQAPRSWSDAVRSCARVVAAVAAPMKTALQQERAPAVRRKEVIPCKPTVRAADQVGMARPSAPARAAPAVASSSRPTPARAAPVVASSLRPPAPVRVAPAVASCARPATTLARAAPSVASSTLSPRPDFADAIWYTGVVKQSKGSMAWLGCDALLARFPHRDVFLHRTDMAGGMVPRQGRVVFH